MRGSKRLSAETVILSKIENESRARKLDRTPVRDVWESDDSGRLSWCVGGACLWAWPGSFGSGVRSGGHVYDHRWTCSRLKMMRLRENDISVPGRRGRCRRARRIRHRKRK